MSTNEAVIPVHIRQAIIDAFKVQMSTEISVAVSTEKGPVPAADLSVLSIMGVKSSNFIGSMALGFPKSTFLKVLETMIGEKHAEISAENADACSELLNIIYASARVKINEAGFDFNPAIPSTICGKEVSMPLGQFNSFMNFSCQAPQGKFFLAFSLKRSS